MREYQAAVLAIALLFVAPASIRGQDGAALDTASFDAGRLIYEENCAQCHQPGGAGAPPDFPALAGNANLGDLALLVTNIVNGKGAMPAFGHLTAEEIAAVATYSRNSWDNDFGGVTADEVEAQRSQVAAIGDRASVWTGVYSAAQAERGKAVHLAMCARCHGPRLNGAGDPEMPPAPAIARAAFLRNWDGQSVGTLFERVRSTMPTDNPGAFSEEQYLDSIAYIFELSGMPPGASDLPLDIDALSGMVIEAEPAAD